MPKILEFQLALPKKHSAQPQILLLNAFPVSTWSLTFFMLARTESSLFTICPNYVTINTYFFNVDMPVTLEWIT